MPGGIGPCSRLEVFGTTSGYLLVGIWLYFSQLPNASSYAMYWVVQDIFGGCMCVLFLSTIRLPSIRVAAYLLVAAFFYDIFFVFITPLIFKSSVMITVATGGQGPTTDPLTCEKLVEIKCDYNFKVFFTYLFSLCLGIHQPTDAVNPIPCLCYSLYLKLVIIKVAVVS